MWGQRAEVATGDNAEGDKLFGYGLYSGALTPLIVGQILAVDFTDAAEHNAGFLVPATKLTNPVTRTSGGKLFNGATANAGLCVGVWQPESAAYAAPVQNTDVVRFQYFGRAIVNADGGGGAGHAVSVGDFLGVLGTTVGSKNNAYSSVATPVVRQSLGIALATGAFATAFGTQIIASGAGNVAQLNAFVIPD